MDHQDPSQRRKRHGMPRIEERGGTYFVNFHLRDKDDELSETDRETVLRVIAQGQGIRYRLYSVVVMPTHVHLIVQTVTGEKPVPLPKITQHIKGFSALKINQLRGCKGRLWQPRSHTRLLFTEKHIKRVANYIYDNPRREGLVEKPNEYQYLWYLGKGPLPFVEDKQQGKNELAW
jgi:REP element-mobilizing transposase RayT